MNSVGIICVCIHLSIHIHTYICMHVITIIKEKEALSLRGSWGGKRWEELEVEKGGEIA